MPEPARTNTQLFAAATQKGGVLASSQARLVSAADSSSGPRWDGVPGGRVSMGKGPCPEAKRPGVCPTVGPWTGPLTSLSHAAFTDQV